ncbi:MAG: hypothetical protein FWC50_15090 [Planctomycetaceae bacterium]|nr:hypothetical protein [Planctomycetaceae bacterium]
MQPDQNGIRKAAVFLSGLDWDAASDLLKRLPADEAKAIRREMVAMHRLSHDEISDALFQFLNQNATCRKDAVKTRENPPKDKNTRSESSHEQHRRVFSGDGVDLCEFSEAGTKTKQADAMETGHGFDAGPNPDQKRTEISSEPVSKATETRKRFDYLPKMPPFDTARFLAEEGEQLITVVLSQMAPQYSGDVLACFEQPLKREIIRRLTQLDETDEMILDEIDAMLKNRWERELESVSKRKPGLALLEQLLQVVDHELNRDIMTGLDEMSAGDRTEPEYRVDDSYYYDDTCEPPLTFGHLATLEDHELGRLFRTLPHEIVVKSLLGAGETFAERVFAQYPVYERLILRDMTLQLADTSSDERMYARQCVLQGAVQWIEQEMTGDISLNDPLNNMPQFIAERPAAFDYAA